MNLRKVLSLFSIVVLPLLFNGNGFAQSNYQTYSFAVQKEAAIDNIILNHVYSIPYEESEQWSKSMKMLLSGLSSGQLDELVRITEIKDLHQKLNEISSSNSIAMDRGLLSTILGVGVGPYRYYPLSPCRIVDTRIATGGFGGKIAGGTSRSFWSTDNTTGQIALQGGKDGGCNVPTSVKVLAINITTTASVNSGHMTIYPTGEDLPLSSILNYSRGANIANSTIAAICVGTCSGHFDIFTTTTSHLVVDVLGYFDD